MVCGRDARALGSKVHHVSRLQGGSPMQSLWSDADAKTCVATYAAWGRDVALRVYTSRLLGKEPKLVLHGGGIRRSKP